jgi:biopolymer transport protein ExbB
MSDMLTKKKLNFAYSSLLPPINMSKVFDLLAAGGPVMIPIVGLSVATFACAFERGCFWLQLLRQEDRIVHDVLEAARVDLDKAAAIASQAQLLPIGRYLLAPIKAK